MKNHFLCFLLLPLLLCLAHCDSSPKKPQITFSHILSDKSEWHVGAVKWKELAGQKLPGQISIRLVTHASLSNNDQRNELEMVQAGTIGGSWESSILLSNSDPRWTIWTMPWLFDSYEKAEKICTGVLGQEMLTSLDKIGIVGLAYGFNGFRHLTTKDKPVLTLSAMKNLKVRVPSLQMYISLFRLWGADPSQMNFGDLIVALREGTMDGQENPLHVIRSSGLFDIQKQLTCWHYSFDPIVFCVSKQKWNTFSPELQKGIRETAIEAAAFQRKTVITNEEDHKKFLTGQGVTINVPTPEAIQEFRTASEPIYSEYKSQIGEDLINRFIEATK